MGGGGWEGQGFLVDKKVVMTERLGGDVRYSWGMIGCLLDGGTGIDCDFRARIFSNGLNAWASHGA